MQGRGLYISTRVSKGKLERQYPYVKELIEKGELVEATPRARGAKFEDLRFGRATNILESVFESVTKLKKPLIVLDSWDSIAKELDLKERLRIEKSLVGIAEENEAKLVFISEEPHLTTTDYLVDAIITLKDEEIEGRRIRRIEWNKLRGSEIPQKSFLFTLHGGRFKIFQRARVEDWTELRARKFEPRKHTKTHYSSGSEDLDDLFEGGLRKGSTILLEVGKTVPPDWQLPLLASIELNFLALNGCAVNMSHASIAPITFKEAIARHLSEDIVKSRFRIGLYEEHRSDPCFFMLDRTSTEKSFEKLWSEAMKVKGVSGRPCIVFVDLDIEEAIHPGNELLKCVLELSLEIRQFNDVLVLKLEEDNEIKGKLLAFCDRHVKLDVADATLVTYSIRPPSRICHLEYDYSKGYPIVKLTPIV